MPTFPFFKFINGVVVYEIWPNNSDHYYDGTFDKVFQQQLSNEQINLQPGDKLIVNCCNEGPGPVELLQPLDYLTKHYDVRVLFSSAITQQTEYPYMCYIEHMVNHCGFVDHIDSLDVDWENITIEKSFISLNRRATLERCKLTKKLLDNFDHDTFLISCGSEKNPIWNNSEHPQYQQLHNAVHPHKIPILLDGEIGGMDDQHCNTTNNWFSCLLYVVTESSDQTDIGWTEIFITEKTFKSFMYRQIPIFNAVPGTVNVVRNLGFDVFDDIIDHSYDTINDSETRMQTMVVELKKITEKYNIDEMTDLRKELWPRINKNVELVHYYNKRHNTTMMEYFSKLSNEFF